jgi:hypothetical protein
MCCCRDKKEGCQRPEDLKGRPEDCTAEQVRACHGESSKHRCLSKGSRKKQRS